MSFDENGRRTSPGPFRMNAKFKEAWAQVCQEFGAKPDPEKAQQLLKEAGRLLRGAAGAVEVKPPTDS